MEKTFDADISNVFCSPPPGAIDRATMIRAVFYRCETTKPTYFAPEGGAAATALHVAEISARAIGCRQSCRGYVTGPRAGHWRKTPHSRWLPVWLDWDDGYRREAAGAGRRRKPTPWRKRWRRLCLAGRRASCKIITNACCDDLFEMLEQRLARPACRGSNTVLVAGVYGAAHSKIRISPWRVFGSQSRSLQSGRSLTILIMDRVADAHRSVHPCCLHGDGWLLFEQVLL